MREKAREGWTEKEVAFEYNRVGVTSDDLSNMHFFIR